MSERMPFEARLTDAFSRYADQASVAVEPSIARRAIASGRRRGAGRLSWLRSRPPSSSVQGRLALLGVAAVVSVLVGSIAFLSTGRPTANDPAVGASGAPSAEASPAGSPSQSPRNAASSTSPIDLPQGNWSYGSSTRLPDGRVLILGFDSGAMRAQLWDPATEGLIDAGTVKGDTFESHSATLLPDGRVLIAGGLHGSYVDGPIATAMTWDPATGAFTPTGSMVVKRYKHLAVSLDDGRVLVLGGNDDLTAETYEPGGRGFTALDVRSGLDAYVVATRLADGRVLVLGGARDGRCSEIWDISPAGLSISEPVEGGCQARSATVLRDGRVLVVSSPAAGSGYEEYDPTRSRMAAMLFDPTRGTYTPAGSMSTTVDQSAAVVLADGRVLIAGGYGPDGTTTTVAEAWDAATSSFSSSGTLSVARAEPDTTLLDDGRVLVVGGWDVAVDLGGGGSFYGIPSLEVFDPR